MGPEEPKPWTERVAEWASFAVFYVSALTFGTGALIVGSLARDDHDLPLALALLFGGGGVLAAMLGRNLSALAYRMQAVRPTVRRANLWASRAENAAQGVWVIVGFAIGLGILGYLFG